MVRLETRSARSRLMQRLPPWRAYLDSLLRIWDGFFLPIMAAAASGIARAVGACQSAMEIIIRLASAKDGALRGKDDQLVRACCAGQRSAMAHGDDSLRSGWPGRGWIRRGRCFLGQETGCSLRRNADVGCGAVACCDRNRKFRRHHLDRITATLIALLGANIMGSVASYFSWSMPLKAQAQPATAWMAGVLCAAIAVSWLGAYRAPHPGALSNSGRRRPPHALSTRVGVIADPVFGLRRRAYGQSDWARRPIARQVRLVPEALELDDWLWFR